MHFFKYRRKRLYVEDLPVEKIADRVGTPFYLYSYKTIIHHFERLKEAFSEFDSLICFSVKSNDHLTILRILSKAGSGFDIVSGGELFKVLKAGGDTRKVVFAGVGKREEEIRFAIERRVFLFNIESFGEAELINKICKEKDVVQEVAFRVNPGVEVETHKYDITGSRGTKFGIPEEEILEIFEKTKSLTNIKPAGLHFHLGSQLLDFRPYVEALKKKVHIFEKLRRMGFEMKYLNIGGGLGVIYDREKPMTAMKFSRKIRKYLKKVEPCKIILEPGRFIMGNSGILVTKVLYKKRSGGRTFLIVDAGMNDLIRPALYNAFHKIVPLNLKNRKKERVDIVGPVCESGDFLGLERDIQAVEPGEYLSVMTSGAYGATMGSNYNSRLKPPAVLVKGDKFFVIREREKPEDLIKNEILIDID
ncbi:MAG: diaminopimelate decarboxylase [Candidatus Aminicenantia bacterium]